MEPTFDDWKSLFQQIQATSTELHCTNGEMRETVNQQNIEISKMQQSLSEVIIIVKRHKTLHTTLLWCFGGMASTMITIVSLIFRKINWAALF